MAYAALLSLSQVIDELLPRERHYSSLCGKNPMISLSQSILRLQGFLELVPERCASMTKQLESRLTDVIYQVEDLIQSNVKVSPCAKSMIPAGEIKSVFRGCIEEIKMIIQDAKKMEEQFKQHMVKGASVTASDNDQAPSTTSIGEPSNHAKVGINEDLDLIIDRVTSRDKSLQIIPIVGMGGIGKTTLARAVFEDPAIVSHFDVCFWVTISQEYNVQEILKGLLEGQKPKVEQNAKTLSLQEKPTAGKTKPTFVFSSDKTKTKEKLKVEPLDLQVHKHLFHRRFLIVMDDMWHPEAWERVMSAIPKDQTGSRVILTTRSSAVAEKVDSSSRQHQMRLMNNQTAWNLLRESVYICESCLPQFEGLGRRIAEKCDGLPLTIVVVGGLLKSNMTEDYWEEVERNINKAATRDGRLDAVLSLSFNNLPAHLKSCFLYMGVFPEDFRIPASKLFWLWIAQGFIKPHSSKALEEIAEEYLEDLVKRNLVSVVAKRSNGRIRSCSIHDVPRELSLRIAKQDKFLQRFVGKYIDICTFKKLSKSHRHVSVSTKTFVKSSSYILRDDYTFVRSLLFVNCPIYVYFSLAHFRLLKVLYDVRITGEEMLYQILELTNLRFLRVNCRHNLSSTLLHVPQSIYKLQKLETFMVTGGGLVIPQEIWKIRKLRHMVLSTDCRLIFPPFSDGYPALENLQTLSWGGRGEYMSVRMPNLKKLKEIESSNYGPPNFGDPCKLESLAIRNYHLKHFALPHSIRKLSLHKTGILSLKTVGALPKLQVLKLSGDQSRWSHEYVPHQQWSPWKTKEGEFLELKYLEMREFPLECWQAESTHFPRLEKLVLRQMGYLEIPLEIVYIATLQKLIVNGCYLRVNESADRLKDEQDSLGTDGPQVIITNRRWWSP